MFVSHNSIHFAILPSGWDIKTKNDSIMTNKECRLYSLVINGKEFYNNLLVISGEGYDIIFSMDWLSTFHLIIVVGKEE